MSTHEFLIEEYRYLITEKERYYKERDYTTIIALTIGIPLVGFGIKESNSIENLMMLAVYFLLPLILFLYLLMRYFWTELLALKADAYIRYKIENQIEDLNWFKAKNDFTLGGLRCLNKIFLILIYVFFIAIDLWMIYFNNTTIFYISLCITIMTVGLTFLFKQLMRYDKIVAQWEDYFTKDETIYYKHEHPS